jgi:hypothetical protein
MAFINHKIEKISDGAKYETGLTSTDKLGQSMTESI